MEKDQVGLALTQESLRVVYLRASANEQKVLDVVKRDLRDVAEEEVPHVVQTAIAELRAKKAEAFCVVPASSVTTKNIEIPSLDPQEIKSIIDLQAGRHTPYSREEILVGYVTIGIFQRNYTKVLLIIVNRELVMKQLSIFEAAGLKISKVLFAPEGVARFYADILNVKEEDPPVGVIDIAHDSTDFIVEFNKTAATCRNIPLGMSQLIKDGNAARDNLIAELVKSLEAYLAEDIHKAPETYVLTSDDAKVKELQPILQEKLKANIKILPYLDRVHASQSIILKLVTEFNDESFLSLIAAGFAMPTIQVDLTPDEVKMQRSIEDRGRELVKSAIFAFVFLVMIGLILLSKVYFRWEYLDKLKTEFSIKHKSVVALDRVAQRTRIIKDYVSGRLVGLEVIRELYSLIPDEIYLENISVDENGTINIQGVSESMSRVFNFVTALEESALFKSVKTKSTTAKKDRGKDVAAFEINFRLESAPDAGPETSSVEPAPAAKAAALPPKK